MMFYTVISGWLFYYFIEMAKGRFQGIASAEVDGIFSGLLAQPGTMFLCAAVMIIVSFAVCAVGLQAGVERVTKMMMLLLFGLLLVLAARSVTLPGAEKEIGRAHV